MLVVLKGLLPLVWIHVSASTKLACHLRHYVDIELGVQPTPTSFQPQEREEAVTASAPPAEQIGDVAASEHADDGP